MNDASPPTPHADAVEALAGTLCQSDGCNPEDAGMWAMGAYRRQARACLAFCRERMTSAAVVDAVTHARMSAPADSPEERSRNVLRAALDAAFWPGVGEPRNILEALGQSALVKMADDKATDMQQQRDEAQAELERHRITLRDAIGWSESSWQWSHLLREVVVRLQSLGDTKRERDAMTVERDQLTRELAASRLEAADARSKLNAAHQSCAASSRIIADIARAMGHKEGEESVVDRAADVVSERDEAVARAERAEATHDKLLEEVGQRFADLRGAVEHATGRTTDRAVAFGGLVAEVRALRARPMSEPVTDAEVEAARQRISSNWATTPCVRRALESFAAGRASGPAVTLDTAVPSTTMRTNDGKVSGVCPLCESGTDKPHTLRDCLASARELGQAEGPSGRVSGPAVAPISLDRDGLWARWCAHSDDALTIDILLAVCTEAVEATLAACAEHLIGDPSGAMIAEARKALRIPAPATVPAAVVESTAAMTHAQIAKLTADLAAARGDLDRAGVVLGEVCVLCTLTNGEKPLTDCLSDHAAIHGVCSLLAERNRLEDDLVDSKPHRDRVAALETDLAAATKRAEEARLTADLAAAREWAEGAEQSLASLRADLAAATKRAEEAERELAALQMLTESNAREVGSVITTAIECAAYPLEERLRAADSHQQDRRDYDSLWESVCDVAETVGWDAEGGACPVGAIADALRARPPAAIPDAVRELVETATPVVDSFALDDGQGWMVDASTNDIDALRAALAKVKDLVADSLASAPEAPAARPWPEAQAGFGAGARGWPRRSTYWSGEETEKWCREVEARIDALQKATG